MKSHNVYCMVIGLVLFICTSNFVFCNPNSFNQYDHSSSSPIPSGDEVLFDIGELNWTSEVCFLYKSYKYFHFTIQCVITNLSGGYQFNFTYDLEINSTSNENSSYGHFIINGDFLMFALFQVQFIHDEYIDVGYLYIPNINENTTLISALQPLVIFQDEIPRGYRYHNTVSYEMGLASISKSISAIYTLNPKELQSNFDGWDLWVQDIKKFSFKVNMHLSGLVFMIDFRGNYSFFLGDGVHSANSSADMLYNLSTVFSPSIFSVFNINQYLAQYFARNGWAYSFGYGRPIIINQTNYNDNVFQNITEHSEVNVHDYTYYANNTPFTFKTTFLELHLRFQLENITEKIEFELPIKQVQFDEEETSTDTRTTPGSSIVGFPLVFLVGISVISVLYISIQVIFRKNHHHSKNSRVKQKII